MDILVESTQISIKEKKMYKFIYWILLTSLNVRKIPYLGLVISLPMYLLALPFRKWLRNTVYNYTLNKGKYLKRLYERKPVLVDGYWILDGTWHNAELGKIKHRDVNIVTYWFTLFMWGFLDDDSNYDTLDVGHLNEFIVGKIQEDGSYKKRFFWMPQWLRDVIKRDRDYALTTPFGNSFDLGDDRVPVFRPYSSYLWFCRNTAYNFSYKFYTIADKDLVWDITIWKFSFGWEDKGDGSYDYKLGLI